MVEFEPVLEWVSGTNPDNGHTYAIYRAGSFENPISWFGARNTASLFGGYLATVTSETEEMFLQGAFAGSKLLEGVTAWIGLSDEIAEGTFQWMTGPEAGQLLGYADWLTGEPNNNGCGRRRGLRDVGELSVWPLGWCLERRGRTGACVSIYCRV